MSVVTKVPKRISTALFSSLAAGVTPRVGLEYIVVGRKNEINALLDDLGNVQEGGAAFRIITGRYGSGKSFLLQLLRNYAMDRNFVVADADLSLEHRLAGSGGQGVATYRELVNNLATRTRPDGGALPTVLERWIVTMQQQVMQEKNLRPADPSFADEVEKRIFETTSALQNLVHGFDFAAVISSYWRGHRERNDALQASAIRWLRGEYSTKTDARRDLDVRVIVDDDTWYDHLKLLAELVHQVGYSGLVTYLDEAVNLYKITNSTSRANNYEKLLTILNDCLQGKAQHLAVLIGGTPAFLEDQRRGLFSYDALRTRLQTSRFARDGFRDLSSPVFRLQPLESEEIFVLLQRIRDLHGVHHGYDPYVSDQEIVAFMEEVLNQLGASEFLTPRDVIRDFVSVLNVVRQNSDTTFLTVVKGEGFTITNSDAEASMRREDSTDEGFASFEL